MQLCVKGSMPSRWRPTARSALAGTTLLGVYLALRHAVLRVAFGAKRGPLFGPVSAPPPVTRPRCVLPLKKCNESRGRRRRRRRAACAATRRHLARSTLRESIRPRAAAAAAGARRPIAQVRLLAERHTGSKSFDSWLASHLCACERAGCAHVARSRLLRHRHWCRGAIRRDSSA